MSALRKLAIWAALAVLAGGCARQAGPPAERPMPRPPAAAKAAGPPASPEDYVAAAASIDLFAIRSGELAVQRSRSAPLQRFAATDIADHQGMAAQLSFAGRRLNILPAAAMLPGQRTRFDELNFTADFDVVYRRQQIEVHRQALKLHSAFALAGDSPSLRPVAKAAVPAVQRHLDALEAMP